MQLDVSASVAPAMNQVQADLAWRDGPEVRVAGWRKKVFALACGAAFFGIAGGAMAAYFAHVRADEFGYAGALALTGAIASYFLYSLWKSSIREVVVSDTGVLLRTGAGSTQVQWWQLLPFRYPVSLGEIGLEWRIGDTFGTDNIRLMNVTRGQARAILGHPAYPHLEVRPEVRRSLELLVG